MDDIFIPKAADPQDTSNFNDNAGLTPISFQGATQSLRRNGNRLELNIPEFSFKNLNHLREKNKEALLEAKIEYEGDYSSENDLEDVTTDEDHNTSTESGSLEDVFD